MALLVLIMIGAIMGWLASIFARTEDVSGILKNVGLGGLACIIGGLIMNGGAPLGPLTLVALGVGVLAALILLAMYNVIFVVRF